MREMARTHTETRAQTSDLIRAKVGWAPWEQT